MKAGNVLSKLCVRGSAVYPSLHFIDAVRVASCMRNLGMLPPAADQHILESLTTSLRKMDTLRDEELPVLDHFGAAFALLSKLNERRLDTLNLLSSHFLRLEDRNRLANHGHRGIISRQVIHCCLALNYVCEPLLHSTMATFERSEYQRERCLTDAEWRRFQLFAKQQNGATDEGRDNKTTKRATVVVESVKKEERVHEAKNKLAAISNRRKKLHQEAATPTSFAPTATIEQSAQPQPMSSVSVPTPGSHVVAPKEDEHNEIDPDEMLMAVLLTVREGVAVDENIVEELVESLSLQEMDTPASGGGAVEEEESRFKRVVILCEIVARVRASTRPGVEGVPAVLHYASRNLDQLVTSRGNKQRNQQERPTAVGVVSQQNALVKELSNILRHRLFWLLVTEKQHASTSSSPTRSPNVKSAKYLPEIQSDSIVASYATLCEALLTVAEDCYQPPSFVSRSMALQKKEPTEFGSLLAPVDATLLLHFVVHVWSATRENASKMDGTNGGDAKNFMLTTALRAIFMDERCERCVQQLLGAATDPRRYSQDVAAEPPTPSVQSKTAKSVQISTVAELVSCIHTDIPLMPARERKHWMGIVAECAADLKPILWNRSLSIEHPAEARNTLRTIAKLAYHGQLTPRLAAVVGPPLHKLLLSRPLRNAGIINATQVVEAIPSAALDDLWACLARGKLLEEPHLRRVVVALGVAGVEASEVLSPRGSTVATGDWSSSPPPSSTHSNNRKTGEKLYTPVISLPVSNGITMGFLTDVSKTGQDQRELLEKFIVEQRSQSTRGEREHARLTAALKKLVLCS